MKLELLAKTTEQGKCRKVSFPRTQQNSASGFRTEKDYFTIAFQNLCCSNQKTQDYFE